MTLPSICTEGFGLLASECNACFDTESMQFTTRSDVLFGRVLGATSFDWAMLLVCTLLVASNVHREMREIRTCQALFFQFAIEAQPRLPSPWLFVSVEVTTLRHCCVAGLVISTVPMFSLGMGMDALNVRAILSAPQPMRHGSARSNTPPLHLLSRCINACSRAAANGARPRMLRLHR